MGAVQLVTNVTAGLIILVSALKYLRSKRGPGTLPSSSPAAQAPAKAWLLVVTSKFRSIEDRDALLEHVHRIATHSANHEQDTLGFQVAIADNDPLKILVFERFATKEAWSQAHRNSSVYKKYKAWQASANIQVAPTIIQANKSWKRHIKNSENACRSCSGELASIYDNWNNGNEQNFTETTSAETTGQSYDEVGWGFLTDAELTHRVQQPGHDGAAQD